jgi:hypothetical protein
MKVRAFREIMDAVRTSETSTRQNGEQGFSNFSVVI